MLDFWIGRTRAEAVGAQSSVHSSTRQALTRGLHPYRARPTGAQLQLLVHRPSATSRRASLRRRCLTHPAASATNRRPFARALARRDVGKSARADSAMSTRTAAAFHLFPTPQTRFPRRSAQDLSGEICPRGQICPSRRFGRRERVKTDRQERACHGALAALGACWLVLPLPLAGCRTAGAVKCALRHGKPSHSQRGRGDDEGAATVTVCDGGNDGDGGGVGDNAGWWRRRYGGGIARRRWQQ